MKGLVKWTFYGVATGLALLMLAFLFQDKIVFQASKLSAHHSFSFEFPFEEHFIQTQTGDTLNALLFRAQQTNPKGLVIYFHGNATNLQRWGMYAPDFTQHGWNILMVDYRGYGKSTGTPDEEAYYRDAEVIYRWAEQHVPHERFIIYGRSLGSSIAAELATRHTPERLVLETPFYELKDAPLWPLRLVFRVLPLRYRFPTYSYVQQVRSPIVIFHGTSDWIVSQHSAARLEKELRSGDQFFWIQNGSHNDLREFESYRDALRDVLR